MPSYAFRLVNVFAETTLAGNALCVFEDARGLTDEQMQALALQFNLSETTFVLPPDSPGATRRMRIFTPDYEMPFAGHPTLGTAAVVGEMTSAREVVLAANAGLVPVSAEGDRWTLTAPGGSRPRTRAAGVPAAEVAALVGLAASEVAGDPLWVDTGSEQLLLPVRSVEAVRRARPDSTRLPGWPTNDRGNRMLYVFAIPQAATAGQPGEVESRFFFDNRLGLVEDPGTGSACANLGAWLRTTGHPLPARYRVSQGAATGRPCHLELSVDAEHVRVGGRVVTIGRGEVTIGGR